MSLVRGIVGRLERLVGFQKEHAVHLPGSAKTPTYYIVRRTLGWGGTGFFSNVLYALSHIAYAKEQGYIPVVDMRNYGTLYSERHAVNGTKNAWEYYFRQPVDTRTAYRSGNFILSDGLDRKAAYLPFLETDDRCELDAEKAARLHALTDDYAGLRPELEAEFRAIVQEQFAGKNVLGIHYRGTDKRNPPPGHRYAASVEQMLDAVGKLLSERPADLLFLASDEAGIREILEEQFHLPVFTTASFRMPQGDHRGLHTAHIAHARKNHRYLLGLEVLRDATLLAACDRLVFGHSNVTNAALYLRRRPYDRQILLATTKPQSPAPNP